MNSIFNYIEKKAIKLDKKCFSKNEKIQIRLSHFFSFTSKITSFFLFSSLGKVILSLIVGSCFFLSAAYFRALVAVFADESVMIGIKFAVSNVPFSLIFLFLFTLILLDLSWFNTFLVLCPSINARIKLMYGESFLKERFYNSSILSVKAAASVSKQVAAGIVGGVIGGAITNVYGEYIYRDNYSSYLDTIKKHPELAPLIKPPAKGLFGFKLGLK